LASFTKDVIMGSLELLPQRGCIQVWDLGVNLTTFTGNLPPVLWGTAELWIRHVKVPIPSSLCDTHSLNPSQPHP
jgi:hypothetical protein